MSTGRDTLIALALAELTRISTDDRAVQQEATESADRVHRALLKAAEQGASLTQLGEAMGITRHAARNQLRTARKHEGAP